MSQTVVNPAQRGGYFSFKLVESIHKAEAFFILRIKKNLLYTVTKRLAITSGKKMPQCFKQLSDEQIQFDNDDSGIGYRLIRFKVLQSEFMICTNRSDLTTLQVIMLYAYRWQVELMFKFLKRSLNGIHLLNNSENGVNIQFYILMITVLLKLRLKQICIQKTEDSLQTKSCKSRKAGLCSRAKAKEYAIRRFKYLFWR